MDKSFWIAIEIDCFHPNATKVKVLTVEEHAMWLGDQFLVFEKAPGIAEPFLISNEIRKAERESYKP
jgi:hypothetical protein